jgi:hypothetical protein
VGQWEPPAGAGALEAAPAGGAGGAGALLSAAASAVARLFGAPGTTAPARGGGDAAPSLALVPHAQPFAGEMHGAPRIVPAGAQPPATLVGQVRRPLTALRAPAAGALGLRGAVLAVWLLCPSDHYGGLTIMAV